MPPPSVHADAVALASKTQVLTARGFPVPRSGCDQTQHGCKICSSIFFVLLFIGIIAGAIRDCG